MPKTYAEQVAETLRKELEQGRWTGIMPGRDRLAGELEVNARTVDRALTMLENEGVLVPQGAGRRRKINRRKLRAKPSAIRVKIILYEQADFQLGYMVGLLHALRQRGHEASFASKSLSDLRMNVERVARFVGSEKADAWIVLAGSKEVLGWFADQPTPAFALFGRSINEPLPSIALKKWDAMVELVDRLVAYGHQRIVMLTREERRKPTLGAFELLYLKRLQEHGIRTGEYNLPDWGNDSQGLKRLLDALFRSTPPTALIVDEPALCVAVMQYLSRASLEPGIRTGVSLACMDRSETFQWCEPQITHISWNAQPIIQRVAKWVDNVSRGQDDLRKTAVKAQFIPGGTIGPVAGKS